MNNRECIIEWKNNISEEVITRVIPFIYESDRNDVERMLNRGYLICISEYSDIAFMTFYTNRAQAMAKAGETLVYPCGQVITIRSKSE